MKIRLDNVRLSFCDIFTPTDFQGDGSFAYKAKIILTPGKTLDALNAAIDSVAAGAFGKNKTNVMKKITSDNRSFPLHPVEDSDEWTLSTRRPHPRKSRPLVLDENRLPVVEADGKIYPGCYVNLAIELYAGDYNGNRVSATLEGVQFVKNGIAFSSAVQASRNDFEDIAVDQSESADDLW